MSSILKYTLLLSFLVAISIGCGEDKPQKTPYKKPSKIRKVPSFQEDNAYNWIEKQVSFGHRYPGTDAHRKTVDYLSSELAKYVDNVIEQDFKVDFMDVKGANATNIIGVVNPLIDKRIILCAHFDTRKIAEKDSLKEEQNNPILGADDGGSGVGVLLEIARLIKENGIDVGVDFILFDAEDNGLNHQNWCLGSKYWGKTPHEKGYDAEFGILLDMVGHKDAEFGLEQNSAVMAKDYQDKIWNMAKALGKTKYFKRFDAGSIEDDHVHVYKGQQIPMVDIIYTRSGNTAGRFGTHHHTQGDNMDIISKETLNAVGKTVTAVVYNFSNGRF